MPITNIFKTGSGGGFEFPAETIILTGEDLSLEQQESGEYLKLDETQVLLKSEAPKLWEIYKQFNGSFVMSQFSSRSNTIIEIAPDVFASLELGAYSYCEAITFCKDFDFTSSTFETLNFSERWALFGFEPGILYLSQNTAGTIIKVITYDHEATTISDLMSSLVQTDIDVSSVITTFHSTQGFALTKDRIIIDYIDGGVKIASFDRKIDGTFDVSTFKNFTDLGYFDYSEHNEKIYLWDKDVCIEKGTAVDLKNGNRTLLYYSDFGNYWGLFQNVNTENTESYFSFRAPNLYKTNELLYDEIDNIESNTNIIAHAIDENNFILTSTTSTGLNYVIKNGISSTTSSAIINYDSTYKYAIYVAVGIQSRMKTIYNTNKNRLIVADTTSGYSGNSAMIEFIEDEGETFVIEAVVSSSTDKSYWILKE